MSAMSAGQFQSSTYGRPLTWPQQAAQLSQKINSTILKLQSAKDTGTAYVVGDLNGTTVRQLQSEMVKAAAQLKSVLVHHRGISGPSDELLGACWKTVGLALLKQNSYSNAVDAFFESARNYGDQGETTILKRGHAVLMAAKSLFASKKFSEALRCAMLVKEWIGVTSLVTCEKDASAIRLMAFSYAYAAAAANRLALNSDSTTTALPCEQSSQQLACQALTLGMQSSCANFYLLDNIIKVLRHGAFHSSQVSAWLGIDFGSASHYQRLNRLNKEIPSKKVKLSTFGQEQSDFTFTGGWQGPADQDSRHVSSDAQKYSQGASMMAHIDSVLADRLDEVSLDSLDPTPQVCKQADKSKIAHFDSNRQIAPVSERVAGVSVNCTRFVREDKTILTEEEECPSTTGSESSECCQQRPSASVTYERRIGSFLPDVDEALSTFADKDNQCDHNSDLYRLVTSASSDRQQQVSSWLQSTAELSRKTASDCILEKREDPIQNRRHAPSMQVSTSNLSSPPNVNFEFTGPCMGAVMSKVYGDLEEFALGDVLGADNLEQIC